MTGILSRPAPTFDITSASFRGAAGDLGEVIALLAGGVRPDPEALSRLGLSLRALQGFLLVEAAQQEAREQLLAAVAAIDWGVPVPLYPKGAPILFVSPDQVTNESQVEVAL